MVTKLKRIYTALKQNPDIVFVGKPKERINLYVDPVHDLEFIVASKTPLLDVDGLNELLESLSAGLKDTRCYNKKFSSWHTELTLGYLHHYEPVGEVTKTTNRTVNDPYLEKKVSPGDPTEESTGELMRSIAVRLYPSVRLAKYAIKERDESYYKHLDRDIPNRVLSWFHPSKVRVQSLPYKPRLRSVQLSDYAYVAGYIMVNGKRSILLNIKDRCAVPCNELVEDDHINVRVSKPTGKAIIHKVTKKSDAETYHLYKKLEIFKER